jgi:hypothetical protein
MAGDEPASRGHVDMHGENYTDRGMRSRPVGDRHRSLLRRPMGLADGLALKEPAPPPKVGSPRKRGSPVPGHRRGLGICFIRLTQHSPQCCAVKRTQRESHLVLLPSRQRSSMSKRTICSAFSHLLSLTTCCCPGSASKQCLVRSLGGYGRRRPRASSASPGPSPAARNGEGRRQP